ncbi:MAG: hypothetical protein AB8H79_18890 [Myxococcota bacterium]
MILCLCTVTVIAALPMPGPSAKKLMKDEAGLQELRQWVGILGAWGWHTDEETLGEQVMVLAKTSRSARNTVVDPCRPFFRLTGTWQGWGLFAYPDTHPHSLHVQVAPARGGYDSVYESRDPDLRWMGTTLHFRRVRALYNPDRKAPGPYRYFTRWLSERAFEDYPDAERVRVSFTRQRTPLPWEDASDVTPSKPRFRKVHHRPKNEDTP